MHSDGRDGLERRWRATFLAALILGAACKKVSGPTVQNPGVDATRLPMPSSSTPAPANDIANRDPEMERVLTEHYGNDEAKKAAMRATMWALAAEGEAAERLAEKNRRTMVAPAPADFKPEATDRKVRLAFSLQETRIHAGDFLRFHLEMTNAGRQAIDYHDIGGGIFKYGGVEDSRSISLYVTDPRGRREKLDAAPASRKVKGAKPVHTGFNFLPDGMPEKDKEKWLEKTLAESAASTKFRVKLLPGETLKSLGDKDSKDGRYRTIYCEQDFVRPGRYKIEAVLDDRPTPLTKTYIDAMLRSGSSMKEIQDLQNEQMREALGPISSNAVGFEVVR